MHSQPRLYYTVEIQQATWDEFEKKCHAAKESCLAVTPYERAKDILTTLVDTKKKTLFSKQGENYESQVIIGMAKENYRVEIQLEKKSEKSVKMSLYKLPSQSLCLSIEQTEHKFLLKKEQLLTQKDRIVTKFFKDFFLGAPTVSLSSTTSSLLSSLSLAATAPPVPKSSLATLSSHSDNIEKRAELKSSKTEETSSVNDEITLELIPVSKKVDTATTSSTAAPVEKEIEVKLTLHHKRKPDEATVPSKAEPVEKKAHEKTEAKVGHTFGNMLDVIRFRQLIAENKAATHADRFRNIFYDNAIKKNAKYYIQHIQWVAEDGTVHPISVHLKHTDEFLIKTKDSPADLTPSSWLFNDNIVSSGLRKPLPHFKQINPNYEVPVKNSTYPKYYNLSFYERDNPDPVAFVFSARCGNAIELVNLKKGNSIAGRHIFNMIKDYAFGLFPQSRPVFADMSYSPANTNIILRVVKAIRDGITYYQSIGNVKLVEGTIHAFPYDIPIRQEERKRIKALTELQTYPINRWYKLLPRVQQPKLSELYKKYFPVTEEKDKEAKTTIDFGKMNLKTFLTPIVDTKNKTDLSKLMDLLETGLDLWTQPTYYEDAKKGTLDYFKYLICQLAWGGLMWEIMPSEPQESKAEKTVSLGL